MRTTAAPLLALCAALAACGHAPRPTVTGAELYARVQTLQSSGTVTVGEVSVRKEQTLATPQSQTFLVTQLIDQCRGGDPTLDADCALALLLDQRFTVLDRMPELKPAKPEREDRSSSIMSSVVAIGLAAGAAGGLIYGVATCEFEGCEAVFGVPLVLVAGGALFILLGH